MSRAENKEIQRILTPNPTNEAILKERWELAHLKLDEQDFRSLAPSPFENLCEYDLIHPDEHLLSVMMDPDNFGWTCSKLFNTASSKRGLELLPLQCVILREMWRRPFPMLIGSRGLGKSFLLALYAMLRALFVQGRKIIITGAGFRQSKIIFSYAELLWYNSPILRDFCAASQNKNQGPHHDSDQWWMQIGESLIISLPVGDGSKIRGQRAHDILTDEFASLGIRVFEEVIAGFGSVQMEPIENVKYEARIELLNSIGAFADLPTDMGSDMANAIIGNQLVLSGTATFAGNHFYTYWKKQKGIITSGGNPKKLRDMGVDANLNHKNFSIFRIPFDMIPKGFMSKDQVDRLRNTLHSAIYQNEFGATFSVDSDGFFKRSVIEAAAPSLNYPIQLSSGEIVTGFSAVMRGDPNKKYIMGIDPASENDNFSIVILEVYPEHARIVHIWTSNRKEEAKKNKKRDNEKNDIEKDFYAYCVRKIRNLMSEFPCQYIVMDSQGGGRQISEGLHNFRYLEAGEQLIWPINEESPLWNGKELDIDGEEGLHIIELVNFADAQYTVDANHSLRDDLEQHRLLFPYSDQVEIVLAGTTDYELGRTNDTLEDVVSEVEELKDELTLIKHTQSGVTMRDRWAAPEIKEPGSPKGRYHDDRYAALLIANFAAHRLRLAPPAPEYAPTGGWVGQLSHTPADAPLYAAAPAWMKQQLKEAGCYGRAVGK
jgi:hypothetical protein